MRGLLKSSLCALAILTGCAQVPVAPPATTPAAEPARTPLFRSALSDDQRAAAMTRYRKQADEARKSGDLAAATTSLQVLSLLAPGDEALRRELASTRAAATSASREHLQAGQSALSAGDLDRATSALLHVLALDPQNADAARALREIDRRRLSRIQADRAARVKQEDTMPRAPRTAAAIASDNNGESFDLEQALELFRAGDAAGGLRDLRSYVEANPGNRAGRQRISTLVADRARELEDQGSRETALNLYEQAVNLRGEANPAWTARISALRKTLSKDYVDKAARMYRIDLAQTIKLLETGVRYDPSNAAAAAKLKEAQLAQEKLNRIDAGKSKRP